MEDLSRDIGGLQSGKPRALARALQRIAVTARAWHRLPRPFAFDQRFASGDAAGWHVGEETGMRVPYFRAERIGGDFKNTVSDRLGAAVGRQRTMTARGGDEGLRR